MQTFKKKTLKKILMINNLAEIFLEVLHYINLQNLITPIIVSSI